MTDPLETFAVKSSDEPSPSYRPVPFSEETPGLLRHLLESKEQAIPTFSETLDYNLNGGLRRKTLIGIASSSGGGKTTFGWQLAQYIAENGRIEGDHTVPIPCMYISLEMAKSTLLEKALSRIGRIDGGELSGRKWLTESNVDLKDEMLKNLVKANQRFTKIARNLRVLGVTEAAPGLMTIDDIRREAEAFLDTYTAHQELTLMRDTPDPDEQEKLVSALELPPQLVIFVDHLQLLSNTKDPTTNAYLPHDPAVSYDLKRLAVSLDCTVVALSRMESEDVHPVIQGADMTAVLKTGYNLIEEKIKALEEEFKEMKSEAAAPEEQEELKRERSGHERFRSQKPLQSEGNPIYASLDIEKNREGRTRDALFVWRRAFHEFEEVAVEEESRSLKRFLPWNSAGTESGRE